MRLANVAAGFGLWLGGACVGAALWGGLCPPREVEVCPARHLNCLIAGGWTSTDPEGFEVDHFED